MRLLVVGGRLQGTEAVYLAAKAGWETVLVDRREAPPAAALADRHIVTDIVADESRARTLVTACDAVLPACEDLRTLEWLAARVPAWGVPLLFDLDAYRVSESKLASQRLFEELDVPRPLPWPTCGLPAVVKPDSASGSEGVSVVHDEAGLSAALARLAAAGHEPVVEEYVAGPSLSLEVLAWNGHAVPLQVTGLEFDAVYDCKRVVAPVGEAGAGGPSAVGLGGYSAWDHAVASGTLASFDAAACLLAEGLGLNGLMDVEVMVRGPELKVLEIDARLPSQTPTAVYWSCGLNIVELLYDTLCRGAPPPVDRGPRRACVYQHVRAHDGLLDVAGEHVMGNATPLHLVEGFFGVDEALTDYRPAARAWAATLIATGATVAEARARADGAVLELARCERLDLAPEADRPAVTEETGS
ncbi:MAG TPA: ATP-grasp domain-containing protein [Thermoleophilia bacterium]